VFKVTRRQVEQSDSRVVVGEKLEFMLVRRSSFVVVWIEFLL